MRQLVVESLPDANGQICLTGKDARYLRLVLRLAVGDFVETRLPSGTLIRLRCKKIENRVVVLQEDTTADGENLFASAGETGVSVRAVEKTAVNLPELWLFQCMPKPQKMDLIIRQAVEIGVTHVVPVASAYAFSGSDERTSRLSRWRRIVKEARQQSGSAVATTINESLDVRAAVELWKSREKESQKSCVAFIFSESALETKPLFRYFTYKPALIATAVGPEGGFSTEEQSVFAEAGFLPLHFNINVLRTETAALYGLAVLQNAVMEFDSWRQSE